MNTESKPSEHWTQEQLIGHLYGVGPQNRHLDACEVCSARLSAMQTSRRSIEELHNAADHLSVDLLAAQRRSIYARLDRSAHWWQTAPAWRWVSAAAAVLIIVGGLTVVEQTRPFSEAHQNQPTAKVSDAQLAADVSQAADNSEPQATAPLQALFEE
jgi:anti-sigma-K factor RskA